MRADPRFPVLLGLVLTLITGTMSAYTLFNIYRAERARAFPTTIATITRSEITYRSGRGGSTGIDIRYTFEHGGRRYVGDNYRYGGNMSSSDRAWADEAIVRFPNGSKVPVHFNPDEPTDSVLLPGVDGTQLVLLLFLMPFNMMMVAMWWAGLQWLFGWGQVEPNRATWWEEHGGFLRVRVPHVFPVAGGLAALSVLSFLSTFVVLFGAGGFHPSVTLVSIVWSLVFAGAIAAGLWLWHSQRQGNADIVVDRTARTIEFPALYGRSRRQTFPLSDFDGIGIADELRERRKRTDAVAVVRLLRKGGGHEPVQECYDDRVAGALAQFLRDKLDLPERRA